jgi:large subunit ribosomal protein L29
MGKNTVKAADIRTKTDKELETRLVDLHKERFNLRFQRATGQLANPARAGLVRKEIAKIETVVSERRRGVTVKVAGKPADKAATGKETAKPAKAAAKKKA